MTVSKMRVEGISSLSKSDVTVSKTGLAKIHESCGHMTRANLSKSGFAKLHESCGHVMLV